MFNTTSNGGYSLSDIAAVTGNNRNGGYGDGFGGNGAWWIIILFLFVFCGWGNGENGFGNRGNNGGAMSAAVPSIIYDTGASMQRGFDNQTVISKLDGINSGICSLGYDQLAQMNGINANVAALNSNLSNAICQLGYNVQQGQNATDLAILNSQNAQTIAAMQNQNALQAQLAECCCENRAATKDVQYAIATNACAVNTNNSNNTRDIIDAQNASTRAILEAIQQSKIDAMQDKITTLTAEKNVLAFQASQASQNEYLINQLKPCPIPAYITCSPYQTYPIGGCNSGCNCG